VERNGAKKQRRDGNATRETDSLHDVSLNENWPGARNPRPHTCYRPVTRGLP
jgi:hypothetical protein